MPALLEAAAISFAYTARGVRRSRTDAAASDVISNLSMQVEAGAIVGILGPNGSGKTTLTRLLAGALTPTAGAVTLDGTSVTAFSRSALARRVAVVPQETHLAFDYTAIEIVLMGRYPRLGPFEIEGPADIASALDALTATGTRALAARPFPTLSGGEKQRVIIASALAQLDDTDRGTGRASTAAASLLLLDEPTSSLDLHYQLELAVLLKRLNKDHGVTILLTTHDLRFALSVCSSVLLLAQGRVLAQGTPDAVLVAPLISQLYDVSPAQVAPLLG